MTALMVATITVKDLKKFQAYLQETQKIATPYGARLLFRGKLERSLTENDPSHGMVVIVEFPSQAHIDQWYNSAEYRPLIPLREEAAVMSMTSYTKMS